MFRLSGKQATSLWCFIVLILTSYLQAINGGRNESSSQLKGRRYRERSTDKRVVHRATNHRKIDRERDEMNHRRLQFDELDGGAAQASSSSVQPIDSTNNNNNNNNKARRRKERHSPRNGPEGMKASRSAALTKAVESILLEADRYHMWWTGPQQDPIVNFIPESWSAAHNPSASQAVFTMAVIQGPNDNPACSSPNDLILYLGSLRRVFSGDIVMALEIDKLTNKMKQILSHYKAIVYVLPKDLCSKETNSIFCGSIDERVPSSIFRYYFYEKWAAIYSEQTKILLTDFRDIIFQANPFDYHQNEWFPDFHLAVFQEFYPNMVINRCRFNRKVVIECYGEESLKWLGTKTIISSGAILGTRDAILVWTHHMTLQLQEAPGRMVETRCFSGGIDHGFINWLVYGKKLRQMLRIRIFSHGEGAVNSLGGLKPDTVVANITGPLQGFWKLLTLDGNVVNWNGDISPVVHQLDHFHDELLQLADTKASLIGTTGNNDRMWQVLPATRCLFECKDSFDFDKA